MNFRFLIVRHLVHVSFLIAVELPIRGAVKRRKEEDDERLLPWRHLDCPYDEERVGSEVTQPYHVEYAKHSENILIPCCKKYNTSVYDSWYKANRFFFGEVVTIPVQNEIGWYGTDLELVYMEEEDAGVYYCDDDRATVNLNTFFYIVDIEYPGAPVVRGDINVHREYTEKYIDKVQSYLDQSYSTPSENSDERLRFLRSYTGLILRATIRWNPWTECDYCLGYKVRRGRCHIEPYEIEPRCKNECEIGKYTFHMDCRSYWTIGKFFPKLAEMIKDIPDVEVVAKCIGTCSDSSIKPGFDYQRKLRNRILTVGSSAILSCPGFTPKKLCFWRRNGIKIEPAEYDSMSKVNLNQLCQLYLEDVTKKEAGNYTCYLDDKFVQENNVVVEESQAPVSEQWARHRKYLLYVTLLCLVVLVGGIVMACIQRGNFIRLDHETLLNNFRTGQLDFERTTRS